MLTPTPSRRFNLVQLQNLTGVALVRYDSGKLIVGCAGAAIRMKYSDSADIVACLTPEMLLESMKNATLPEPETRMITKDRFRRESVCIRDTTDYTKGFVEATPGGSWGMLTFGRVGVKPNFETLSRDLDDTTWNLPPGGATQGYGAVLPLSPDAVMFAEYNMSAWEMMVTAATLIGGVDKASIPPCDALGSLILKDVVDKELSIRAELEKRRVARRFDGAGRRDLMSAVSRVTDPDAIAALEAILADMNISSKV
jgi:hypothetical protein